MPDHMALTLEGSALNTSTTSSATYCEWVCTQAPRCTARCTKSRKTSDAGSQSSGYFTGVRS